MSGDDCDKTEEVSCGEPDAGPAAEPFLRN
jgi:hypothetical protein